MHYYGTAKRTVSHDQPSWCLTVDPHVMVFVKRMFPRLREIRTGEVRICESPSMCHDLEWFMMRYPMEMSPEDLAILTNRASYDRESLSLVDQLLSGVRVAADYELALAPRGYQRVAADLVVARGSNLLADDLGIGKTCSAICVLSRADARPALVVSKAHLTEQWRQELQKFLPGVRTHVLEKSEPYDYTKPTRKRGRGSDGQMGLFQVAPEILIASYAKLSGWFHTLKPVVKTVIFDECQELRHDETKRYTAACVVTRETRYRMGLSATPIHNYGNEIYNVLNVLSPGELGEKNEFNREWCSYDKIANPKAFGTFARERGLILRRTLQDVGLEMPKYTKIVHPIDADPEALRNIESPATELAKIILKEGDSAKGEKWRASEEFSNILRQATGIAKALHVAAFVSMLLESGEKVILWGWHHAVYDIWKEQLKHHNPVMFTGHESTKQKMEAKRKFIMGETNLLIMSLRSGDGTDGLQDVCHIGVVGELDWSPSVHNQCGGRIFRPGQLLPVIMYFLVATEGSDPVVMDVLGLKSEQSDGILNPQANDVEYLIPPDIDIKQFAAAYLKRKQAA